MRFVHADILRRAFMALRVVIEASGLSPTAARMELLRAVDDIFAGRRKGTKLKVRKVRGELRADTPTAVAYALWMADVDLDDPVARTFALKTILSTLYDPPARPPGEGGAA